MFTQNRDKKYWMRLGGFTFGLLLVAVTFMTIYFGQRVALMLVKPSHQEVIIDPSFYGHAKWEAVNFQSPDGLNLSGWFMPPASDNGATIIYVHGHVGSKMAYLPEAILLNEQGFGALVFDQRNNGESEGELTTFGLLESRDVQGAVDYLLTRPDVDPDKIGVMGISMGGSSTMLAVPDIPEIQSVILQSTFSTLERNIHQGLEVITGMNFTPLNALIIYYAEKEAGFKIEDVRPIDHIADISPRPLLIMHGDADELLDVSNSYALYDAAKEPKEMIIYEGLGHVGYFDQLGEEYILTLIDFFTKTLLEND